jgi:hypothetical protein
VVFPDPGGDRVLVAPDHDGVDQFVAAAAGEIALFPAELAQVVQVVRQGQVQRHIATGHLARP